MQHKEDMLSWDTLSSQQQLELRESYGRYLDGLPRTCCIETKIERFRRWLEQRNIKYRG